MGRRPVVLVVVITAAFMALATPAWASTFTVNSTANTGDNTPDGTCDDTATIGIQCTLREAMQEASANNNEPTVDAIDFAILGTGPHTISPSPELPDIDEPLTIDGYTQPGANPNTQAFGSNAALKIVISGASATPDQTNSVDGFDVEAGPTTIRGLVINGFQKSINGSGGQAIGIFNVDGNTNNVVEGNFIGTDVAGTGAVPNEGDGVIIFGPNSSENVIGGTTPASRNVIAGNGDQGVEISGSEANTVRGNLIGTAKTGTTDLGNGDDGVRTTGPRNLVTDNVVAFNGDATNDDGVEVLKSGLATPVGNRILNNSIFSNQALGIDLNDTSGPSAADPEGREQDPKDPDTGPNNLQNFPVITSVTSTGTTTTISGTLNSKPRKTFIIQLFSNPILTNEGETFLGQVSAKTNRKGKASFSFFGPAVPQADEITATATGADGTSEFSDPKRVIPAS